MVEAFLHYMYVSAVQLYPYYIYPGSFLDIVEDRLLLLFLITDPSRLQRHVNIRSSGFAFRKMSWVEDHDSCHDLATC